MPATLRLARRVCASAARPSCCDEDFPGPGHRVRVLAQDELFGSAMTGDLHRTHNSHPTPVDQELLPPGAGVLGFLDRAAVFLGAAAAWAVTSVTRMSGEDRSFFTSTTSGRRDSSARKLLAL